MVFVFLDFKINLVFGLLECLEFQTYLVFGFLEIPPKIFGFCFFGMFGSPKIFVFWVFGARAPAGGHAAPRPPEIGLCVKETATSGSQSILLLILLGRQSITSLKAQLDSDLPDGVSGVGRPVSAPQDLTSRPRSAASRMRAPEGVSGVRRVLRPPRACAGLGIHLGTWGGGGGVVWNLQKKQNQIFLELQTFQKPKKQRFLEESPKTQKPKIVGISKNPKHKYFWNIQKNKN